LHTNVCARSRKNDGESTYIAGELFNGTDDELVAALKAGSLTFHEGHIGGSWPRIIR
jgi:hypothetical protein